MWCSCPSAPVFPGNPRPSNTGRNSAIKSAAQFRPSRFRQH
jgi:hypothetical protein